jgi:hypothetical protein
VILQVLLASENRSAFKALEIFTGMSQLVSLHVGFLLEELLANTAAVRTTTSAEQMTSESTFSANKNFLAVITSDFCKQKKMSLATGSSQN